MNSEKEIRKAVDGCDAVIWCATGFSNAPNQTLLSKLAGFIGVVLPFKRGIDIVGVSAIARALSNTSQDDETKGICGRPKFVMLSSAGVTRPQWSDEKKKKLEGCAEIPIVRLNPFGILDLKAESEDVLRASGKIFLSSRLRQFLRLLYIFSIILPLANVIYIVITKRS